MNNRIYPSWNEIHNFHNPLTDGEEKLAKFLDDTLPADWMIFIQPYLNGSRPDVVIFNPQVGIMIYEVKDGDLHSFQWNFSKKSPVKQVEYYKRKIIDQLVPRIGEAIDEKSSIFGLIRTGVYFHKIPGEDARNFFNTGGFPVISGYDDLFDSNLKNVVPDSDSKGKYMRKEWIKEILFWLKPPIHSIEQTQDFNLSPEQRKHAEPQSGHFRLKGATGSGKTLIIAYRAAKLASQGFNVLVLTYNITLWHYIRDMIARTPFEFDWEKIVFNHFHGFCNDVLNKWDVPLPNEEYFEKITSTLESALQTKVSQGENLDIQKFDAILIDEGQDFEWEWYKCLSKFLTNRNELFLVCDKKQNLYDKDLSWIDGEMRNVQFRGPWRKLKTIYRLPKKIGDAADRFSKMFELDQSVEVEDYIQLKLSERPLKPHIVWKNIPSGYWLDHIKDAYEQIKSVQSEAGEGHPSDIVILLPTNQMGIKVVRFFEKLKVEVNHVFENDNESKYHRHKKAFWLGDGRLKMSTIHSFKGWEALHIILLIPSSWTGVENLDVFAYTAMTRTRENLIVLNQNKRYVEYGKSLPNEWDKQ